MPLRSSDLRREANADAVFCVRIPKRIAETAKALAEHDGSTIGKYISDLIRNDVRQRGGVLDGGDLGMADTAIQSQVVPDGQAAIVTAASEVVIAITASVYIRSSASLTAANAIANIVNDLDAYLASVQIGGINAESSGIVPWSELLIQIANANANTVSVQLSVPSGDTTLLVNQVPVLTGSPSFTIVFV